MRRETDIKNNLSKMVIVFEIFDALDILWHHLYIIYCHRTYTNSQNLNLSQK